MELRGHVLQQHPVLIFLLDHPYLLLEARGHREMQPQPRIPSPPPQTQLHRPHLVLDLSPGQLAHGKLHQHVEEGPQVIMATHLLEGEKGATHRSQVLPSLAVGAPTFTEGHHSGRSDAQALCAELRSP